MTKLRNRHFFLNDLILLPIAVYLSYVLRLDGLVPAAKWWPGMFVLSASITVATVLVFYQVGVYARFWRYASVDELMLLTGAYTVATLIATTLAIAIGYVVEQDLWIPRSIPFILLLLGLVATAGPRLSVRIWTRHVRRKRVNSTSPRDVLIMGAGDTGTALAREIQNNPQLGLDIVGYLDDDKRKHDMVIHGAPVLGGREAIPTLARQLGVDQVIIAMPSASGKQIREVVRICEQEKIQTRTVPGTPELLDGRVSVSQLREVRIDDLLRREPITTDLGAVRELLQGKRVLITGGGGSIGSELARQVHNCAPQALILVGHGENSIYGIYHELAARQHSSDTAQGIALYPVVADIRSDMQMHAVFRRYQPELVFHAAAHKHVPLMEINPCEAVLNNVGGTRCLLRVAQAHGVERFVMVSTDKAVNPTSIMGATKRVAERMVESASLGSGGIYVTVRFGNVLGSRGSVIPVFQRQIAAGGPVTVTHPEITRYFMTIPEAVQLVLQACTLGSGGELFMLDMGEPVKIVDLATELIRLSGLEVGRDIDIVFTGLRPGEKMYEELFLPSEAFIPTSHDQIRIVTNGNHPDSQELEHAVDLLLASVQHEDIDAIYAHLGALVPGYDPSAQVANTGLQASA